MQWILWRLLNGMVVMIGLCFGLQLAAVGMGLVGLTSDDGLRIVFSSNAEPSIDSPRNLYIMKPDGSGIRPMDNLEGDSGDHACSPHDNRIAFTSTSLRTGAGIHVVSIDGSSQAVLTASREVSFSPTWSPDGRKLAFVSIRNGLYEIYMMNDDGTHRTPITHNAATNTAPAWSPDGQRIAFVSRLRDLIDPLGFNDDVFVVDVDGSHLRRLTYGGTQEYYPAWSPDGQRIAYTSGRDGSSELYVMDADGGETRQLTANGSFNYAPAWSPDGAQIAFVSNVGGNDDVYVMNADGTDTRRLTFGSASDAWPCWLYIQSGVD
jgi:Tol biopolymer transport system component